MYHKVLEVGEIGMWKGRILGKELVGLGELGIYPGQLIQGGGNTQAGDMRGQELLEQGVRHNVSFGLPLHSFATTIINIIIHPLHFKLRHTLHLLLYYSVHGCIYYSSKVISDACM